MPALSPDVELLLYRAFASAKGAGHAHVDIEHVLLASLEMPAAVEYFEQRDIGIRALRADLASKLSQAALIDPTAEDQNSTSTTAFQTAIQRAILTAEKEFRM